MSHMSVKVKNRKAPRTHEKAHHLEREELEARYEPICESKYATPSRDDRARGTDSRTAITHPSAKVPKSCLSAPLPTVISSLMSFSLPPRRGKTGQQLILGFWKKGSAIEVNHHDATSLGVP
ncbi:hypothetical protein HC256_005554 [Beauveria bassiana]|nr:hypothetical protein HC256_005554 [Beauveria bassiana]